MASNTVENDISLRKITDMTRMISILILALHFYHYCYQAFQNWHLTFSISDRILDKISAAGLFSSFGKTKILALIFLTISLVGVKGKKGEDIRVKPSLVSVLTGLMIYLLTVFTLKISMDVQFKSVLYMTFTSVGFLLILSGGSQFSRLITARLSSDIFNKDNESFPQFERLLENEYSINLPAEYRYKGKFRQSWINVINPFRGLLVSGSPGSGKTFFVFRHVIGQHIEKGFSMFVYDFKYGLTFNLIFAFISHACVDKNFSFMVMPLVVLAILALSYVYGRKMRQQPLS